MAIIVEDCSLGRVVITIADIVSTLGDVSRASNVICNQSKAIWAQALKLFCVEAAVLDRAIVPVLLGRGVLCLRSELEIVVEEILALNELPSVPFGHVAPAIGVDECAVSMELALIEVALIDD